MSFELKVEVFNEKNNTLSIVKMDFNNQKMDFNNKDIQIYFWEPFKFLVVNFIAQFIDIVQIMYYICLCFLCRFDDEFSEET